MAKLKYVQQQELNEHANTHAQTANVMRILQNYKFPPTTRKTGNNPLERENPVIKLNLFALNYDTSDTKSFGTDVIRASVMLEQ